LWRSDISLKELFDYSNKKTAYFLDFGSKAEDQDKKCKPHVCCTVCSSKRNAWEDGKGRCMPFGVPLVWRVPVVSRVWCSKSGMPVLTERLVPEGSWFKIHAGRLRIDIQDSNHTFGE